ncbi:sensor domain-containing diguanylate cyclase [Fusibacter ferrireducens]|nr:sensor domain-containing diguanylate cyclase [Fusibacter ferrireducens]
MLDDLNYKKILDQLFDGVYIVDKEKRIIYWNEGAKRISGFKSEEVIGRYCHDNILNHVDEYGINLCLNGCPLHQTLSDGSKLELNVYLQHKRGHRIPVKIRSFPVYEADEIVASVEVFTESFDHNKKPNAAFMMDSNILKEVLTDPLTNLPNRRMIDHYLNSKMEDYRALGIPFGIVMIDIDSFEEFNNTYGEDLCDQVIQMLGRTYSKAFRIADLVGRWREDEFIFVFTGIKSGALKMLAERIRMISENSSLRGETFKDIEVTVSVGATLVHQDDTALKMTTRCYERVKKSKAKGGNNITMK